MKLPYFGLKIRLLFRYLFRIQFRIRIRNVNFGSRLDPDPAKSSGSATLEECIYVGSWYNINFLECQTHCGNGSFHVKNFDEIFGSLLSFPRIKILLGEFKKKLVPPYLLGGSGISRSGATNCFSLSRSFSSMA
jgi:hypothetical protein